MKPTGGDAVRIREPVPADAEGIAAVHVRAWQQGYRGLMPDDYLDTLSVEERAGVWRDALSSAPGRRIRRLVAEEGGTVAGFLVCGPQDGEQDAEVGQVYALNVDPASWGRGVGGTLLAAGTDHLRSAGFEEALLWVHTGNTRARRFYEANGWEADGTERDEEVLGVLASLARYRRTLTG